MAKQLPKPELLAPAGDEECMRAAVNAGADAVYFGLADGFNARARAANFATEELPRVMDYLHAHAVQGFVTFNTLVFDSELGAAERTLRAIASAGVDALIVQDFGVARLARELCPQLELHASTQMTVSSAEGAQIAASLGISRLVVPRELSIAVIKTLADGTDLELECFVHGALCMSWSGQCLTSEAMQSRSANRGQCAQSCRLPYDLFVDGVQKPLGDVKYLLSPKDLAAYDLLGELLAAGVSCFKLEGRMKGPEYVTNVVDKYRRALDAILSSAPVAIDSRDLRYTFSRSFSHGFLKGSDHQTLVHGRFPGHRGVEVGAVREVDVARRHVYVSLAADAPPLNAGDRILFDQGRPEEEEPRGTLFAADPVDKGAKLVFGGEDLGGPVLSQVRVGDRVFKARDANLVRSLKRIAATERKLDVVLRVSGRPGEPLVAHAQDATGRVATAESSMPLQPAQQKALDEATLAGKLGAFGETPFRLAKLELVLPTPVVLPPSELKRMRRALSDALVEQPVPTKPRTLVPTSALPTTLLRTTLPQPTLPQPCASSALAASPVLVPLLRTMEQVHAAIADKDALRLTDIELDFMELVGLGHAVDAVRAAGLSVIIATPRVQKPGEEGYDRRFDKLRPDGILARHWGAVQHFREHSRSIRLLGDFSLNATNALTARTLLDFGLDALTPSYDLDQRQLLDVCAGVDAAKLEVTLHQHLPLYHTEHCVYSHTLSSGKDFRTCGRPCEKHTVSLRDTQGFEHPVLVDIGCRNTVFNARAQSAASCLPSVLAAGVRRYRVELVRETGAETALVLSSYRALLDGALDARTLTKRVNAIERYGVTAGTLHIVT